MGWGRRLETLVAFPAPQSRRPELREGRQQIQTDACKTDSACAKCRGRLDRLTPAAARALPRQALELCLHSGKTVLSDLTLWIHHEHALRQSIRDDALRAGILGQS